MSVKLSPKSYDEVRKSILDGSDHDFYDFVVKVFISNGIDTIDEPSFCLCFVQNGFSEEDAITILNHVKTSLHFIDSATFFDPPDDNVLLLSMRFLFSRDHFGYSSFAYAFNDYIRLKKMKYEPQHKNTFSIKRFIRVMRTFRSENPLESSISAVIVILLAFAVNDLDPEYGFYTFLRLCMSIGTGIIAFRAWNNKNILCCVISALLVVLFQPVIKVELAPSTWWTVDSLLILGYPLLTYFCCQKKSLQ